MTSRYESRPERDDTPREECGVFAVIRLDGELDPTIADKAYRGISGLQHRGEDGAGITVYNRRTRYKFHTMKNKGLITSVFGGGAHLSGFPAGSLALAHTRYGTGGKSGDAAEKAHPHGSRRYSFMIAVNGHMKELEGADGDGLSDTEHLVDVIDARMADTGEDFKTSLLMTLRRLSGGYSLVASDGERLIAARDPWGIRPLTQATNGTCFYFSSEDSALRIPSLDISFDQTQEVPPGSLITVDPMNGVQIEQIYDKKPIPLAKTALCSMEPAYFSRPDTMLAGRNVQTIRQNIGRLLSEQEEADFEADVVIGVPDSGVDSAMAYAESLGIPFARAIHKNAYIGRTFIQKSPEARTDAAWLKFRINPELVVSKRVVIVDDSIVRGTNIGVLVQMLYQAGAKEVHIRAGFPPHRYACKFGIDTGNPKELIANLMDREQMKDYLKVASIDYITPENLEKAISPKIGGLCMACVTGNYPTANR